MFNSESAGGVKVQMCLFCGDKRTQKNAVFKETNYNPMVSWLSSMLLGGGRCIQWTSVYTWLYNFSLLTFDYGCVW